MKGKKKITKKRTHKEFMEENINEDEEKPLKKKKRSIYSIKEDNIIILENIDKIYKDISLEINNILSINGKILKFPKYEKLFFNIIEINPDGNCLYNLVSYYLYGTEEKNTEIRKNTYEYIKSNITFIYEYCYLKDNLYYIDIDVRGKTKTYFIEDK